ncbi:hypothetical protein [Microbispora sp. GKU 823]|uniref:hypothetical protein n=1 Tax=Microbispora sp. GKU 823 TaxID=1652100 RepID=UPI0009A31556|nr:hypothetical protein [Microbispora sp. GKU 823]OPG13490.1 hypothetical protein B1L11_08460 [Microbispora sp. GKU 823]
MPAEAYLRLFPETRPRHVSGRRGRPDRRRTNQSLLGYRDLQRIFGRFTAWCAQTAACALHGEDAGKVWRDLTARADRSPIPVTSERFGRGKLTGSYLRWFGFAPDPGPGDSRWLAFAEAVDKARHGDGSGFADAALGNARVWTSPSYSAMTCADDRGYHGYEEYVRVRREARRISPDLGGATTLARSPHRRGGGRRRGHPYTCHPYTWETRRS